MNLFERKSIADSFMGQITEGLGQVPIKKKPSETFKRKTLEQAAAGAVAGGAMGGAAASIKKKNKKK